MPGGEHTTDSHIGVCTILICGYVVAGFPCPVEALHRLQLRSAAKHSFIFQFSATLEEFLSIAISLGLHTTSS